MLTKEQQAQFFNDGYLIVANVFNADEIAEIKTYIISAIKRAGDINSIEKSNFLPKNTQQKNEIQSNFKGTQVIFDEQNHIKRLAWIGAMEARLLKYSRLPRITQAVSQLLAAKEADHLINQVHPKLPADNVAYHWHQDSFNRKAYDPKWEQYACNTNGSFVQTLLAVDAYTKDNGPIIIIPGSNRLGHLEDMPAFGNQETVQAYLYTTRIKELAKKNNVNISTTKQLIMPAGSLLFMHPYLLHCSEPNRTQQSRLTLINGFSYPGANTAPYPGQGSGERIRLVANASLQ
jgi:ectoine hydroxylase-related dioxygenase (phytanoyl-CoA dioxygenase family)